MNDAMSGAEIGGGGTEAACSLRNGGTGEMRLGAKGAVRLAADGGPWAEADRRYAEIFISRTKRYCRRSCLDVCHRYSYSIPIPRAHRTRTAATHSSGNLIEMALHSG